METNIPQTDRRSFLKSASAGIGLGTWAVTSSMHAALSGATKVRPRKDRLPREVWVATISQNGMDAGSYQQMSRMMLSRMSEVLCFEPDIICLPEVFPFANLSGGRPALADVAEEPVGAISRPFAEFAREHDCYVVCPVYTKEDGQFYNAAVFIDRSGKVMGQYRKMHPTIGEIEKGIAPCPKSPPVFETDFGRVGAQICFDIQWDDGWNQLRQAGAEIVFWPSAFGGGNMVNTRAWQNQYCVVSCTRKGITQICDVSGEAVAKTGHWDKWACAPLNLEKAFLHTWPYVQRFPDIRKKYGRKIQIKTFFEEEWTIIESLSADVKIADVMQEFELKTLAQHIGAADQAQRKARRRLFPDA